MKLWSWFTNKSHWRVCYPDGRECMRLLEISEADRFCLRQSLAEADEALMSLWELGMDDMVEQNSEPEISAIRVVVLKSQSRKKGERR